MATVGIALERLLKADDQTTIGQLLQEVLPIDDTLDPVHHARACASPSRERLEQALGEEQWSFIDSCPAEWSRLPIPNGPLTVGIDGGYVRAQGDARLV